MKNVSILLAGISLLSLLGITGCGGGGGGTADATAPTVTSFTPAEGATNVPNNAVLSITFDEALDPTTLTNSSFSLTGSSEVMGTVAYDAATNTASFTPDAPLELDVLHTATLTTSITDSAGNSLAAVFSITFTTETFIQRVSVANDGSEADSSSFNPSISADGRYIAFASSAGNLLGAGNDTNSTTDIFVHDTQTNTITRVSIASDGTEADDPSFNPSLSADGRYVAFSSSATNLLGAGNDTNNTADIFIRDTQANTTTRVSLANDGSEADSSDSSPSLSADGRYVAFSSSATNLLGAGNDTNSTTDIFVRDTQAETTIRVSLASDGSEADSFSFEPHISTDGRYVAFSSNASNLLGAGNDTNGNDIFVRDTQTNTTTRVNVANDGTESNAEVNEGFSMTADGRYVVFESAASNLLGAGNDTNIRADIFVRDTQANTTTRVSVANDGSEGNDHSTRPSISADGRYVSFESVAGNLVGAGNDTNNSRDIFVRDTQTNTTARVDVASDGSEGNDDSIRASISADGRYVAFESTANNLLGAGNDGNDRKDVFRTLTTPPTPPPVIVSDRRLKKDIVYLASLENGIKLYSFKYLWSDEVYVGVMAQDLLKTPAFSHAVHMKQGNIYAVDYQALGLKMIPLRKWSESTNNIFRASSEVL